MATVKTGDHGVSVTGELTDADEDPVSIEGATVRLLMRRRGDDRLLARDADNDQVGDGSDGSMGHVHYVLQAEDTVVDNAGLYFAEWEATFEDGEVQTFPSNGWNTVAILRDNDEEDESS